MGEKKEGAGVLATLYGASFYRKDIQGLRALGALIIMAFHIWFNKVSGGVDIFIVVSGFLMTALFLRGWLSSGVIFTFGFWSKIIVRIAPSAYIVLLFTVVAGYFLLSPSIIAEFIEEAMAAAFHLENLILMKRSVDYLASDMMPSPIQQFWALSVQVQFYAMLPFLLIPLAYLSNRIRSASVLLSGVVLVLLASFIYAYYKVEQDPVTAYFNPLARGWEFLAGGVLFLLSPWLRLGKKASAVLALLGIAIVFCSAFLIPRGAAYPGPVALIPVMAAVFIILSGLSGVYTNRFLSSRAMVFLGSMSFTIYLWHWPVLIFYKQIFNEMHVSLFSGLTIILLSVVLAYLTMLFEGYIKNAVGKKVIYGYLLGVVFFLPTTALVYYFSVNIKNIQEDAVSDWREHDFSQGILANGISEEDEFYVSRRELIAARIILPEPYGTDCHQNSDGYEVKTCSFGEIGSEKKVILVGGSHAMQWLPALDEVGVRNGFEVINMTKSACPFGHLESANASCSAWNKSALEEIIRISPDLVVTNSTRTAIKKEYIPDSYLEVWKRIRSHDIPIVGVRDNPRFDFDVPECVHRNSGNHYSCAVERSEYLKDTNPALAHNGLINSLDMTEFYCGDDFCPVTFKGYLMYRDRHHLHVPYVRLMADEFEKKMIEAYPELFE